LRRLDENIPPGVAFPPGYVHEPDEIAHQAVHDNSKSETEGSFSPAFLSTGNETVSRRKPLFIGAIAFAVLGSVAVIGIPAGWYGTKKAAAEASSATMSTAPAPTSTQTETPAQPQPSGTEAAPAAEDPAAAALRRQRERERKLREAAAKAAENPGTVAPTETVKPGAKRVVVTVTYDESGRVTQASGGDANALRIARQKRFPPGKAGSATVSIPIN
jgi:hypothetical protein